MRSVASKAGGWGVGCVGCAALWSTSLLAVALRVHLSPGSAAQSESRVSSSVEHLLTLPD